MPAYNFQESFVVPIVELKKTHTIRRRRTRRLTAPGDSLMLYTGMRTKQARMFAASVCVKVEPVVIWPWAGKLLMADERGAWHALNENELKGLAVADGFSDVAKFFEFFKRYAKECLDDFEIVHWDPKALVAVGAG